MANMKIHLRADSADGTHTHFTVFMNGANCGQLCMRQEEAHFFYMTVAKSSWLKDGEFLGSGHWQSKKEVQDA